MLRFLLYRSESYTPDYEEKRAVHWLILSQFPSWQFLEINRDLVARSRPVILWSAPCLSRWFSKVEAALWELPFFGRF